MPVGRYERAGVAVKAHGGGVSDGHDWASKFFMEQRGYGFITPMKAARCVRSHHRGGTGGVKDRPKDSASIRGRTGTRRARAPSGKIWWIHRRIALAPMTRVGCRYAPDRRSLNFAPRPRTRSRKPSRHACMASPAGRRVFAAGKNRRREVADEIIDAAKTKRGQLSAKPRRIEIAFERFPGAAHEAGKRLHERRAACCDDTPRVGIVHTTSAPPAPGRRYRPASKKTDRPVMEGRTRADEEDALRRIEACEAKHIRQESRPRNHRQRN